MPGHEPSAECKQSLATFKEAYGELEEAVAADALTPYDALIIRLYQWHKESCLSELEVFDYAFRCVDELLELVVIEGIRNPKRTPLAGQNPVTFTPSNGEMPRLTLGRLGLGVGDTMDMIVMAAMHNDGDTPAVTDFAHFDQEHFVTGIKKLFPNGELDGS
jgi:hypothetical protein